MDDSQILMLREQSEIPPQSAMLTLLTTAYFQPLESSATSVVSKGTAPVSISGEEVLSRKFKLPVSTPVVLSDLALWLGTGICGAIIGNANDVGDVYYSLLGSNSKLVVPPRLHTVLFVEDASQVVLWGSLEKLTCDLTFLPK